MCILLSKTEKFQSRYKINSNETTSIHSQNEIYNDSKTEKDSKYTLPRSQLDGLERFIINKL